MASDWKAVVGAVAPTLATLLGGPLAGLAVKTISQAVLGKDDGTEAELTGALTSASPETLAKIKEADVALKIQLSQAGVSLEEIAGKDRASARAREIETRDPTVRVLAYMFVVIYFVVIWAVWKFPIDPNVNDLLMILLGILTAALTQILNYYFGSSSGSSAKTAVLDRLVNHRGGT